ncbi:hypothetical protein VISI1226_13673 [Vibrio sinaloensis DSM 21326]|uniref:Uncharacterized protein n=1 Tax=Vibrio sinaloensis DSM 21326 TaxID=945550 RepID=E8M8N0_PHOS4|nr:hypothetical protein [Vibrio sinaloensis]EGA69575.1 hypothetical protein VISI1226_13673 [Vibrio sinaloensis DSM 21326]
MSTIKNNLPTGSERNKVEYLAEAIENARIDIDVLIEQVSNAPAGSATTRPKNLLKNAAMLGVHERYPTAWALVMGHRSKKGVNAASTLAMPAAPFWGMEIMPNSAGMVANGHMKVSLPSNLTSAAPSFDEAMGGLVIGRSNGSRQVVFQVFDPPERHYIHHDGNEDKSLWCYVRLDLAMSRESFRYGVVEIDEQGNATKVMCEKTIHPSSSTTHIQDWLHFGREFDVFKRRFAFFVERTTHAQNAFTLLTGAGVYWGREGEVPELAATERDSQDGFFHVSEYQAEGKTISFKLPDYPTRYAPEKHYLYCVVDANSRAITQAMGFDFHVNPDKTVRCNVTSDLPNGAMVQAYRGECLSINFYDVAA